MASTASTWYLLLLLAFSFMLLTEAAQQNVSLTFVDHAVEKGAVCLDGSPSVYYFDQGEGQGLDNWLIFLEGGGWCSNQSECKERSESKYGSSTLRDQYRDFEASLLSNDSQENPKFYNWNRVYVPYCDGSSFTGNTEAADSVTNVTYRGLRIFEATMADLLAKGMEQAQNALLSGSSAGGVAAFVHCDRFRDLLPITAQVKCLSLASYFLHMDDSMGGGYFENAFEALITLHGSTEALPSLCTSIMSRPSLCFFPQYLTSYVKTPTFIAMSSFDHIQIRYNLSPAHETCLLNFNCTLEQKRAIQDLRWDLFQALPKAHPFVRGFWFTHCIAHELPYNWNDVKKMESIMGDETLPRVFDDWYFNYQYLLVIDSSDEPRNCSDIGISPT
ncbi:unnamed protein product [Cuscuta epithymum]|uniref:Pectin acetylesterase n=1 Tax=Cuscuta epithymum TaxID=186058 RepID=A0AAV0DJQ9_9ASTE|nr:unnamed protein product [Cuscuta epithymum]